MNYELSTILGIPINKLTRQQSVEKFIELSEWDKQLFTATPNAEIILEAQKNPELKKYLKNCALNTPDSVSLLWAAMVKDWCVIRSIFELFLTPFRKHFWKNLPEQVSGSDLFLDICELAEKKGKKIFLLGWQNWVAELAKNKVLEKYPLLKIVGAMWGSPLEKDDKDMVSEINKSKADILFLAYGCPKQELWISRNLEKLDTVKVAMWIGWTFDFISGKIKRSPKIFKVLWLEWLWRLILEPSRINRIFKAVFIFPIAVISDKIRLW